MFYLVRVFQMGVIICLAFSEICFKRIFLFKIVQSDLLGCVVHVSLEKFIHFSIRIKRYEMAGTRAYGMEYVKAVGVTYKADKFIRNDYRFDIHAIYIRFAVYFAEAILPVDCIIYLVYRVLPDLLSSISALYGR